MVARRRRGADAVGIEIVYFATITGYTGHVRRIADTALSKVKSYHFRSDRTAARRERLLRNLASRFDSRRIPTSGTGPVAITARRS